MAPRLRRLSARELIAELRRIGFEVVSTRGSHAKLRRIGPEGRLQTLTIPLHAEIAAGTLRAIYRQVAKLAPEAEIRHAFFRD